MCGALVCSRRVEHTKLLRPNKQFQFSSKRWFRISSDLQILSSEKCLRILRINNRSSRLEIASNSSCMRNIICRHPWMYDANHIRTSLVALFMRQAAASAIGSERIVNALSAYMVSFVYSVGNAELPIMAENWLVHGTAYIYDQSMRPNIAYSCTSYRNNTPTPTS